MKIRIGFGAILVALSTLLSRQPVACAILACSAALHELGHIWASKVLGIRLESMTLGATGALLVPQSSLGSYWQESLLAAAGPIANLGVAGAAYIMLAKAVGRKPVLDEIFLTASECLSDKIGLSPKSALSLFFVFSVLQAGLNLLPVSTFDGGRIFFCILAELTGVRTAEIASCAVSALSAFAVWLASVYILLKAHAGLGIFAISLCMLVRTVGTGRDEKKIHER